MGWLKEASGPQPDPPNRSPPSCAPPCPHRQISHTFTDYGPGVRFVRFEHAGQDSVYWKGWFGARVTNSSVWVEP